LTHIFTAYIGKKTQRLETQSDELFVERIQLAQRGNVKQRLAKDLNISFKWTLRRDELAD
jgi:hypothetical protein